MSRTLHARLLATMCGLLIATSVSSSQAHDGTADAGPEPAIRLYDDAGSPSQSLLPHQLTAAELRQARAWQRQQYREARIEAAKRAGYHLSRPPAAAVPSMTSRYQYARPWLVPVYVYPQY